MTPLVSELLQMALLLAALLLLVKPLGSYMARVYGSRPCGLDRVLGPVERLIYRLAGVNPDPRADHLVVEVAVLLQPGEHDRLDRLAFGRLAGGRGVDLLEHQALVGRGIAARLDPRPAGAAAAEGEQGQGDGGGQ